MVVIAVGAAFSVVLLLAVFSCVDGFSFVLMSSDYYKRAARSKFNKDFSEYAAKQVAIDLKKEEEAKARQLAAVRESKRTAATTIEQQQDNLMDVLKEAQTAVAEDKPVVKLTVEEKKQKVLEFKAERQKMLEEKKIAAALAKEEKKKRIAESKIAAAAKAEEKIQMILAKKEAKQLKIQELKASKLKSLDEKAAAGDKKAAAALEKQQKALKKSTEKRAAAVAAREEKQRKRIEKKAKLVEKKNNKKQGGGKGNTKVLPQQDYGKVAAKSDDSASGSGTSSGNGATEPNKEKVLASSQTERDVDDAAQIEANRQMIERIMQEKKNSNDSSSSAGKSSGSKSAATKMESKVDDNDTTARQKNRSMIERIMQRKKSGNTAKSEAAEIETNPVAAATQTTDMEYDDDDTARIEENRQMIERIMLQKKVQKQKQKEAAQVAGTDDMDGVFAPAVVLTKEVMGVKNLNTLRARVIKEHTTIISKFTDTADTSFGDTVLKLLFELADKDGNGTIDEVELQRAFNAIGCGFIPEKTINGMFVRADKDGNCGLDYEEWCVAAPKSLKTALVKLAKKVRAIIVFGLFYFILFLGWSRIPPPPMLYFYFGPFR